jgi:hypothetical protein
MKLNEVPNPERLDAWLKRLERGDDRQAECTLKSMDGAFCCLGVLYDNIDPTWVPNVDLNTSEPNDEGETVWRGEWHLAPDAYDEYGEPVPEGYWVGQTIDMDSDTAASVGLDRSDLTLLMTMNDGGSFSEAHILPEGLAAKMDMFSGDSISYDDSTQVWHVRKHTFPEIAQAIRALIHTK